MIFFFVITSFLYIGFFLWCRYQWYGITEDNLAVDVDNKLMFTILIPVRNEANNVSGLLHDLDCQSYPKELFEVIVIDDDSSDDTRNIVENLINKMRFSCRILKLVDLGLTGKKQALTLGVSQAENEIILATDGDCRLGTDWIKAYASAFSSKHIQMVTGPVKMSGPGFFQRLQSLEFSGLIGIGASTLTSGSPTMCNGANLGYRKAIFQEVGGYTGNEHIASGDDEFLLQKVFRKASSSVKFLKSQAALVITDAKPNLAELINQRIRWSSKWKYHNSLFIKVGAVLVFMNYLMVYLALTMSFIDQSWLMVTVGVVIVRWLALSLFLFPLSRFSNIAINLFMTFCLEIIYPLLVLFLGIASIFGHYSWKGRRYQ